jgi:cephalosporin hydroxylase
VERGERQGKVAGQNARVIPVYEPSPMGVIAQVHIDVWKAITESMDELGYKTFIELGVYRGGTGMYFLERCLLDYNLLYVGVDIHHEWMDREFKRSYQQVPNCRVMLGSVFDPLIKKQLAEVIDSRGLTMVFMDCGGENLKRATGEYAPLLKTGDYLLIHDYPDEIDDRDVNWLLDNGYELVDREKWLGKLNTPLFRKHD